MVKLMVKNSLGVLVLIHCLFLSGSCVGQPDKKQVFQDVLSRYKEESTPIPDLLEMDKQNLIEARLLNSLLFDMQEDEPKHYVDDTLYRIPIGKIVEDPFDYVTHKRVNGGLVFYDTSFPINVYALGRLDIAPDHVALITRVVGFMTDYIDIYLFEKSTGTWKSVINAFEAAHAENGHPEKGYQAIYNNASIEENGQIKWHQERFGVTTDRTFDVSPDGYFRVIYQKSEGEFER